MKKLFALLTFFIVLCTNIYASPIHLMEEKFIVADGISLTKVRGFYSDHNISYSYIEADLSNENVGLKLLTPEGKIDSLSYVKNLAETEPYTVSALNADFFSTVSGKGSLSLGIEIKDGTLLQSPIKPQEMATVYEKDGVLDISYLDFHIMAVAPNGAYEEVVHLNKHTTYFGSILMYTSEFNGGFSPSVGGEVLEVLVEDGIVKEFRRNMPPCKIPENGCVLVVSEGSTMFFANNFNVGDKIKFDYYVTPDILSSDSAFGGGAVLVSEGKALTSFSHVVSGYNPRSAIGVSKDGTKVYLVAVDGRSEQSRGMTMSELASLMASLGCYKAINLDGGGSTNMVAKTLDNPSLHTVNSPSEQRKVINAVGITYESEKKEPKGIMLKASSDSVFIGQGISVSAYVYDENMQRIEATPILSSDNGSIKNGILTPSFGPVAKVKASFGKLSSEIEIPVIDSLAGIDAPSSLKFSKSGKEKLSLSVFDKKGNTAQITNYAPFVFSSSDPSVAYFKDGYIYAKKDGSAVISVSKDDVVSYISVSVGGTDYSYFDGFEESPGSFSSYPAYVGGDFYLTDEVSFEGNFTGALYYDFTAESEETKASYLVLSNPLRVSENSKEISLYVKTEDEFCHSLKLQLKDGEGKELRLSLYNEKDSDDFTKYTAFIPDDASYPLYLTKIYVVALPGEPYDEGTVYLDNLSFLSREDFPLIYAPDNVYKDNTDFSSKNVFFKIGAGESSSSLLSGLARENMIESIKEAPSFALLGLDTEGRVNKDSFYSYEDKNALYISLNTKNGGIRNSSKEQWNLLKASIDKSKAKNIFIMSDNPIFSSDSFENEVIKDYLSNLTQNVCVITKGSDNSLFIEGDVRYFTLRDISEGGSLSERISNYSYLEFSFAKTLSYRFRTVWK